MLDLLCRKVPVLNKAYNGLYLILAPHVVLLTYFFINRTENLHIGLAGKWAVSVPVILSGIFVWVKLNIAPYSKKLNCNIRLKAMYGGRILLHYGLYMLFTQTLVYLIGIRYINQINVPKHILLIDLIIALLGLSGIIINGMLRILCTSRRLHIVKRDLVFSMLVVPVLNIFVILYACHIAKLEYDHDCYKVLNNELRAGSEVCRTRYPLVLVHGVGFRDLKYINYWGRIPKELMLNGAKVYYGNQEAWGTVQYNAMDIKAKIMDILKETECGKVNIIAHSKGGLDARYMISKLDMEDYVASLTTISSPHRGCKFVDIACKIPDKIYKAIARLFDRHYKTLGDKNPDFYTASRQFSTFHSKKFNDEVKDAEKVYYQSYASVVKGILSDYIVSIPHMIVKLCEGENDGLVTVGSARWGEFKGVFRNKHRRGISHGDIIDLRRDDYKGFDVIEEYVKIVSELKDKGF